MFGRDSVEDEVETSGVLRHLVGVAGNDHLIGAEAEGVVLFGRRGGEDDDMGSEGVRELDAHVAESAETNDANFLAHYESTGPEIWKQTNGELTHFFTGCGTGGTITGIATFLKEKNEKIKIVAIQAQKNHLLQGMRNFEESAMPDLFLRRQKVVDEWLTATNEESFRLVKELALKERLLVGPSSGSVMASMVKVAEKLERGNIVGIFADDGTKFRSLYDQQGVFADSEYYAVLKNAKNLSQPAYAFV